MARTRDLKPGFFKNEKLAQCSPHTRLLFASLWCLADREGRLEDRPTRVHADTFPYESDLDVPQMLSELAQKRFIKRYKVRGVGYIQVLNFPKHQHPHPKEQASVIPAPRRRQKPAPRSGHGEDLGTGRAAKRSVLNRASPSSPSYISSYPPAPSPSARSNPRAPEPARIARPDPPETGAPPPSRAELEVQRRYLAAVEDMRLLLRAHPADSVFEIAEHFRRENSTEAVTEVMTRFVGDLRRAKVEHPVAYFRDKIGKLAPTLDAGQAESADQGKADNDAASALFFGAGGRGAS